MTLTEFLLARITEEETAADLTKHWHGGRKWTWNVDQRGDGWVTYDAAEPLLNTLTGGLLDSGSLEAVEALVSHVAHWNPGRVLAQCAAKRKIVERFAEIVGCDACGGVGEVGDVLHEDDCGGDGFLIAAEIALRALASIWSDHPDWREEWA